jgi:type IV pilus assembly protein PilV
MDAPKSLQRARGFSLLEVMVAVIVICIGLLGIAKMQALALSNSNTSRLRSLAAIEAASFAASMHSNRNFWANATVDYTVTPAAVTSNDGATVAIANAELGNPTGCENAVMCAPQNIAAYDLARFAFDLSALLPNPVATIHFAVPGPGINAPPSFTIEIQWSENAVAMTTAQTAGTLTVNPNYKLYVQP